MSTHLDQSIRVDVRLESWQGVPETTEPTLFSERRELWQIAIARVASVPAPTFEVRFMRNGDQQFSWPVPESAYSGLARVFTQGGSFLKASMPHMDREWSELSGTHPHLHSLYEQECLSLALAGQGVSTTGPKWARL